MTFPDGSIIAGFLLLTVYSAVHFTGVLDMSLPAPDVMQTPIPMGTSLSGGKIEHGRRCGARPHFKSSI